MPTDTGPQPPSATAGSSTWNDDVDFAQFTFSCRKHIAVRFAPV
jgi:hypothetical protein